MKKVLLLSALFVPGMVFASEVSDGSDISCAEKACKESVDASLHAKPVPTQDHVSTNTVVVAVNSEELSPAVVKPITPHKHHLPAKNALPPEHHHHDNVFIAKPKPEEPIAHVVYVDQQKIDPARQERAENYKKSLVEPRKKVEKEVRDFTQVEAYPSNNYHQIIKTTPKQTGNDEVLASWTNDCLASAKPNADCKTKCCTPRVRGHILRREIEWFNMFIISLEQQEKERLVSATEAEKLATAPESKAEKPAQEKAPAATSTDKKTLDKPAKPEKINPNKAQPAGKKRVSLKNKKSWKKVPKKIEGPTNKTEQPVKKNIDKTAELRSIINEAVIKMILADNLGIRLEGIATLTKYAPKTKGELREYVERSLLVFLDGHASIDRCHRYKNDPKTDIEKALALLSEIHTADFSVDLTNMNFSGIKIEGLNLKHFDLSDSAFVGAKIKDSDFSGATMSGSDFTGATIENDNFTGAKLDGSYFVKTTIKNSDFTNAKINCSQLRDSTIISSGFNGTILTSVLFTGTTITDSKFVGADLSKADMHEITLQGNNFTKANLSGSNLMKAKIGGDDFSGANFDSTYIKHTNMENAKGLDFDMLIVSYWDKKTKLPGYISGIFSKTIVQSSSTFSCPNATCPTRLQGLEKHHEYLLNVSYAIIEDDNQPVSHNNWALCNINCVIQVDPYYGDEALAKVASFVRKKSPWPPVSNYQASSSSKTSDIQGALHIIGNRPNSLAGVSIDLSKTDLRGADFYGYDMNGVDFSGSNLSGSLTADAKGLPSDTTFTIPSNNK